MNPSDERRNRRISLPLSTTRLAVVALVLTAIGMPVAWASAGFPSSSQVVLAPTPVFLNETQNPGAFDLDSPPVLCPTASYTPTNDSTARMDSWVTLLTQSVWLVRNVNSVDGGNTWQDADSVASGGASHILPESQFDLGFAGNSAIVHLTPGVPYRFGVRVSRGPFSGQGDVGDFNACEVLVEITQDPGSPGPPGPPGTEPGSPPPGPLP